MMIFFSDRLIRTTALAIGMGLFLLNGIVFGSPDKLSPSLLQGSSSSRMVKVVAFLNPEDTPALGKMLVSMGDVRKQENHARLVKRLREVGPQTASFVEFISALADSGTVADVRRYWITDAVSFSVDREFLSRISDHPSLRYLIEDLPLELVAPVSVEQSQSGLAGSDNSVTITGVRELWNKGYTGHGRLVCNFDTGVEGSHPALVANWLGANGGSASQSWFDPYGTTYPIDNGGHGTHTMGIMAGRDGADTIGVAFDANWIAASVVDRGQNLSTTVSDILAAFQWAADPDGNPETADDLPDVVSNSWGIPRGLFAPCDQTFYQAIDNLEAFGVVVIFACGNEGPNPSTIRNPADRAASPTNSFSIGAVDQNQVDLPVAAFSSRGPATCDTTKIKPDVVAPGVSIRSSYRGGTYKLMSGTSMAAPFVAGCVALMREYNPAATVEQIKSALIASAGDLGRQGKDNDYGWGVINVARALDYLPKPQKPQISLDVVRLAQDENGILATGGTTALELSVVDSVEDCYDLWGELRSGSSNVYILNDSVSFGSMTAGQTTNNFDAPFLVKVDRQVPPGTTVSLTVQFYSKQQGYLNSVNLSFVVGQPVKAATAIMQTEQLGFEVTNFGVSHRLFDATAGYNLLSHLSFMIADSLGTVYDALPGEIDYYASDSLSRETFSGGSTLTAHFSTRDNAFAVTERVTAFQSSDDANFVLLDFKLRQGLTTAFTRCHLALGVDIDLAGGETVISDGSDFVFRSGSSDRYVGIRMLPRNGQAFGQEISGNAYKSGTLDDPQKYSLISAGTTSLTGTIGDNALVAGVGPLDIASSGEIEMAAVIASGNSIDEIRLALRKGEDRYSQVTGTDGGDADLPRAFSLDQNYPNPFNAETTIRFSLPSGGDCRFEIIDILGRTVRSFDLQGLPAGSQSVNWDARDDDGHDVATGVYFYRLSFGNSSEARKMILLK
jgi:hypothetical protein